MYRVWSVDAVAKNRSTSLYGSIIALSESAKMEGSLYAGADDGLVKVSENRGQDGRILGLFGARYYNSKTRR